MPLSSDGRRLSCSTRWSTVFAKSVMARSLGRVIRGGTTEAGCSEAGARTNVRNSLVSCRRTFISEDKSSTDSAKECNNGWEEAAVSCSSVGGVLSIFVSSSTSARSACSLSLRLGPVHYFPGQPKSWADFNSLQPEHLLWRPIGKKNETVHNLWWTLKVKTHAKENTRTWY